MRWRAISLALLLASSGHAQVTVEGSTQPFRVGREPEVNSAFRQRASSAPFAVVKALDTASGDVAELIVKTGEQVDFGRLQLQIQECRYPLDNPTGDAFAFLEIREAGAAQPVFAGWMIASSPALNALDHPRYDIWVIRCQLDAEPPRTPTPQVVAGESSPRPIMRP